MKNPSTLKDCRVEHCDAEPEGVRFKLMMLADSENAVLYQLLVGAQDGNLDFPEAETFFESFNLRQS